MSWKLIKAGYSSIRDIRVRPHMSLANTSKRMRVKGYSS